MTRIYGSPIQFIVCLWFASSILTYFIGRERLHRWLRQKIKNLNPFSFGGFGYLEITYLNYCRNQKIPPWKDWLAIQYISL
jgi:hypothetical protein